ncbi:MAG: DUF4395 domain-containing protein [Proteobacteria bacterium]|nr:DUF4395 domain-containing protein [Pseudomonadota bacterium]
MNSLVHFGELLPEYGVRVLNEREVRAGAGILFFLAIISFLNAWLLGDLLPTKVFVMAFLVDFIIRILINPRFSPSLIVGRFFVRNQKPEYVGAPQKRFAWSIGLVLALIVFYQVIVRHVIGPINLLVCSIFLILLFFETAFGICIGCSIYNLIYTDKAQLCPGNECEVDKKHEVQTISTGQIVVVVVFLALVWGDAHWLSTTTPCIDAIQNNQAAHADEEESSVVEDRCRVPDLSIAIGHANNWKLHNNCK